MEVISIFGLLTVNNAAVDMGVKIFIQDPVLIFFGLIPCSEIAGS